MSQIHQYDKQTLALPVQGRMVSDSAIGTGMAFLQGELEKRDERLLEPLSSVTWQRDIVAKTGGGWVEFTSNYFSNFATTGGNENGIIGGQTTDIPMIQANISKDVFRVFDWANTLKVPFVDQAKLQTIGRSLDQILDDGIRLNYNKSVDWIVYVGYETMNVPGIVNNPDVLSSAAPDNAAGTSSQWKDKTPDEILDDVNYAIVQTWENSQYDLTGMANHVLIPPVQYALITTRKVSDAGNVSILEYLLNNNIAKNQGRDLFIAPSRWCAGKGVGNTDRLVAYVNDENRINFDLPVPLTRVMTQPNVEQLAYLTAYAAQIGVVKLLYPTTMLYLDGI